MISYYKLQLLKFTTIMVMFGFTMVTFSTWLLAFLNGDSVVVTINSMGEMWFELYMWILLIPLVVTGTWFVYDDFMKCRKVWKRMLLGKYAKERVEWL